MVCHISKIKVVCNSPLTLSHATVTQLPRKKEYEEKEKKREKRMAVWQYLMYETRSQLKGVERTEKIPRRETTETIVS